jgi:hypothetical protein
MDEALVVTDITLAQAGVAFPGQSLLNDGSVSEQSAGDTNEESHSQPASGQ